MTLSGHVFNSTNVSIATGSVVLLFILTNVWLNRKQPKALNVDYFTKKWQAVQKLCKKEDSWPMAIINADKLVDEALRKSKFKGKTMGERLVAAERLLTDSTGVWYSHKLRNKLDHQTVKKLTKKEVVKALVSFRQTLKDLGALR